MKFENREEKIGYCYVKGAIRYVFHNVAIAIIIIWIAILFANGFDFKTDNSDYDGWNRSGLKIHTDALTGVQYVSTRGGGLTPRIDIHGDLIYLMPNEPKGP